MTPVPQITDRTTVGELAAVLTEHKIVVDVCRRNPASGTWLVRLAFVGGRTWFENTHRDLGACFGLVLRAMLGGAR